MATLKKRVCDLRVGDWATIGAHGAIAVTKTSPTDDGRIRVEYLHRVTKLYGWTPLIDNEMIVVDTWPYGDRTYHEDCCVLREGALFCDCKASDASDTEWGHHS